MPHLIVECSENIKSKLSFQPLFHELHQLLVDMLPTQLSSCKARVLPAQLYLVGDDENNSYIHLTVKILPGRTKKVKDAIGKKIMSTISQFIQQQDIHNIPLSLEILDLSEQYYKEML